MPERIWITQENFFHVGSYRRFHACDLEHSNDYPQYVRADLAFAQLKDLEDALLACEKGQTFQDVLANYRAVRRTLKAIRERDEVVS